MAAVAYFTLQRVIIADQGDQPVLAQAVGRDIKGKLSPPMYIGAILLAFYDQRISQALYAIVALMWLIPDRRIARALSSRNAEH
jgi:hypothetical protein